MLNNEVFKEYNTESWVIEQNLCFLLQEYWEEAYEKGYVKERHMPINPVCVVKKFLNTETDIPTKYAEMSKLSTIEKNIVDI